MEAFYINVFIAKCVKVHFKQPLLSTCFKA